MNPKTKKAQGLSIQTIIIAVLAITVLVVMILIFMGVIRPSGLFISEQLSCEARGGLCDKTESACKDAGGLYTKTLKCSQGESDKGCCIIQAKSAEKK